MNSSAVDAVVLFVTEKNGKPVYTKVRTELTPVISSNSDEKPLVAIKYSNQKIEENSLTPKESEASEITVGISESSVASLQTKENDKSLPDNQLEASKPAETVNIISTSAAAATALPEVTEPFIEPDRESMGKASRPVKVSAKVQTATKEFSDDDNNQSALTYIEAVKSGKWEYATLLDRYIVRFDKETYIVLTIRPALQRILEDAFSSSSTRIGAGIIQDPSTGEILAMTSSHRNQILAIDSEEFRTENWVLRPTFPVASIFKIITGAAGLDTKKITANSSFLAYGKTYMKVWKAFAMSHNAVFGRIARKTGSSVLKKYAEAFGFNKTFFFDLPVEKSIATLPDNAVKMGQAAAGLNRDFLVSPIHVASIVSTVLNRGRTMKPYLVDYVVRKNKVVFRRKPFQIAQPIKSTTARDIYKMMYATTAVGTGKKGFGGFRSCPDLARICGGKTGTLTGASPHYLYTWFGGFTKAAGRDL